MPRPGGADTGPRPEDTGGVLRVQGGANSDRPWPEPKG